MAKNITNRVEKMLFLHSKRLRMKFADVPGNRIVINKLASAVMQGRIPHAQLILGHEGAGKMILALAYSQFLFCQNKQIFDGANPETDLMADSCGECPSCKKNSSMQHPDVHYVMPVVKQTDKVLSADFSQEWREYIVKTKGIVNINSWYDFLHLEKKTQGLISTAECDELIKTLNTKSYEGSYKVVIIWMVEKLFHAAAPKILKILEEPPEGTVFIALAESYEKILSTISSRLQLIKLKKPSGSCAVDFLVKNFSVGKEQAAKFVTKSEGNLVKSIELLEVGDIKNDDVEFFIQWMRTAYQMNFQLIFELVKLFESNSRENQKFLLTKSLEYFNQIHLLAERAKSPSMVIEVGDEFASRFSGFITEDNIDDILKLMDESIYHVERNGDAKIIMTDLTIKIGKLLRKAAKK